MAVYSGAGYPAYLQGFAPTEATWPPAEEVRLVGCSRLTGRATGTPARDTTHETRPGDSAYAAQLTPLVTATVD